MKKWTPLTWTVLAVLSLSAILMISWYNLRTTEDLTLGTQRMNKPLNYIFVFGDNRKTLPKFSFSPELSDYIHNQTILQSLVGTLVKYGTSGLIEPYLASGWSVSKDELEWKFHFMSNVRCEDGEILDAETFKEGLIRSFRRSLDRMNRSEFEHLEGWDSFIRSKEAAPDFKGLSVENNSLIFRFRSRPDNFLNYLRMPYFGYWCRSNFINGKFRTDGKFSSSGSYKLGQANEFHASLHLRDTPFSNEKSIQEVNIRTMRLDDAVKKYPNKSIMRGSGPTTAFTSMSDNFQLVVTPPNLGISLVLKPQSRLFKTLRNRQTFAARITEYNNSQKRDLNAEPSRGFYISSPFKQGAYQDQGYTGAEKIRIGLRAPQWDWQMNYIKDLFDYAFADSKITYEFILPSEESEDWANELITDDSVDVRLASVYGGSSYSPSVVKMMFCSTLGVQYPDPSGRICHLVDRTDLNQDEAAKEFDKILTEDASVIPLYHEADTMMISKDLDSKSVPQSFVYPRFENVRFK